ncbi:DUF6064 family protein [Taklimakanibacter deserti]|uniref:DUF6064 family protein n=1 Tax=Taklimakanibacter deserti TaxID=2267839 RepID=UPI000E65B9CF
MSEWWTYRLGDFLLFSPRVYWRMFELHNAQFWPLHLLTLATGLAIAWLALRQMRGAGSLAALVLAALWIFVGWSFLWDRYAAINWAIVYVAPAFGLEALLLAIAAARGGLVFDRRDVAARSGLAVAAVGLILYPLLPLLFGRPWTTAEVFGIAPDPTAVATLGIVLTASGRVALLLVPIPLAWLLLSGLTLNTMGEAQSWVPLLAAAAAVIGLAVRLGRGLPEIRARSGRHRR